jgi:hypothetical protein
MAKSTPPTAAVNPEIVCGGETYRVSPGDRVDRPLQDREHAQGHDEGADLGLGDQEPVDQTDAAPREDRDRHAAAIAEVLLQTQAHDPGKGNDGADRKIELADDQDQGEPNRRGGVHRHRAHDRGQIEGGQESRRGQPHDHEDHCEEDEDPVAVDEGEGFLPARSPLAFITHSHAPSFARIAH